MGGRSDFTASRSKSSRRTWSVFTSRTISRPGPLYALTTPPLQIRVVFRNCAITGCSSVSPLVPSTVASKSVFNITRCPAIDSAKSGVVVCPSTSMFSRIPPNFPSDERIPEIPRNTPRSASLNVYFADNGVCPGSCGCQGPKVPRSLGSL